MSLVVETKFIHQARREFNSPPDFIVGIVYALFVSMACISCKLIVQVLFSMSLLFLIRGFFDRSSWGFAASNLCSFFGAIFLLLTVDIFFQAGSRLEVSYLPAYQFSGDGIWVNRLRNRLRLQGKVENRDYIIRYCLAFPTPIRSVIRITVPTSFANQ